MENNKGYLRQLGIIFLITFLSAVAVEIVVEQIFRDDLAFYSENMAWVYAVYSVSAIVFYITLGVATKKWTAAIGGLIAFVIIQTLQYFLFEEEKIQVNITDNLYFLFIRIAYLLPSIVFFIIAKTPAKKLPLILFVLLILQLSYNTTYRSAEGFNFLDEVFRMGLNIPSYIFNVLVSIIVSVISLVAFCELLNFGENRNRGWSLHIINPGNEYSKVNATVLFWVLKCGIYFCLLGCISYLKNYDEFLGDRYGSGNAGIKLQYFLTLFFLIFTMLAIAWYLRKFMLEYFATYNFTSRFLYWFLLLPVIGFFAWLVMLAESRKQENFAERERSIQSFAASKPDGIIVVFIILMVLRFSLAFTYNLPAEFIISTLVSIGLFVWLVRSRTGYYVNLYLNLFLVVLILLLIFLNEASSDIYLLFPLLLMNTVQLVLIYPAFHFSAFSYLSYEEEKEWQPGQDLF
ncbi:MAG: hypothetical protein HOP10_05640 [Chitinophagaceae bacterium]|nr:hypothetical protein [Chitinophagaceae bacterium]